MSKLLSEVAKNRKLMATLASLNRHNSDRFTENLLKAVKRELNSIQAHSEKS